MKKRTSFLARASLALLLTCAAFGSVPFAAGTAHASPVKLTLSAAMVTNEEGHGDATRMVDEQSTAGDPKGGSGGSPATAWNPGYQAGTYPAHAYIDLGQDYTLSDIYLFDSNGVNDLVVSAGSPSGGWTTLFTDPMNTYLSWRPHAVNVTTRYVRLTMTGGGANFNEIVLYGAPAGSNPPSACTKTIPYSSTQVVYYGDASHLNVVPGDVVCIDSGAREQLKLVGFNGSPSNPVTIVNHNGTVTVQNNPSKSQGYAFSIENSSYFRLTGTGVAGTTYGFRASGKHSGTSALGIGAGSTNFEVDHVEVFDMATGFAGFLFKSDPICNNTVYDRANFTQFDTVIHDNYIHDTGGEGMYIGNSFYNGETVSCKDANGNVTSSRTAYPHVLKGVSIYNNITDNTGRDGIQLGSATEDVQVYNNTITHFSTLNESGQREGIQINAGSTGKYYNNFIAHGNGSGIGVFGWGAIDLFNNVIVDSSDDGIYSRDDRTNATDPVYNNTTGNRFMNNTIVNPHQSGIDYNNTALTGSAAYNNIIILPAVDASHQYVSGSGLTSNYNLTDVNANIAGVKFVNPSAENFHLQTGSPAIGTGTNLWNSGVHTDFDGYARPQTGNFDKGAFEYH